MSNPSKPSSVLQMALWAICAIVIIAAALTLSLGSQSDALAYGLSLGLTLLLVAVLIFLRRRQGVRYDERDVRVQRAALSFSWFYSYAFLALLLLNAQYRFYPLDIIQTLSAMFFFMLLSRLVGQFYFKDRGDI